MKKIKIILFSLLSTAMSAQCLQSAYYFSGDGQDALGNANTATVSGATLTNDRFGNPNSAYEFDGINDYIDTKTTFDYDFKSISFWAYPHTIAGSNAVVCQDADASKLTYGSTVANFRDDSLLRVQAGGALSPSTVLKNAGANQWYHVVLIREGSGPSSLKCYINGVAYPLNPSASGNNGSVTLAYEFLVIGANRKRTSANFDGLIDDVLIYNCAIDSATVDSLYNFHPTDTLSSDTCLVAHYPFNQGSVVDVIGNSSVATIQGATPTANRLGAPNSAYYFDGSNDYINTNTTYDYNSRTVAFWFRADDSLSQGAIVCQDSYNLNYGSVTAAVGTGQGLRGNAAGNSTTMASSFDLGTWYHVALVRDGSVSRMYLNGQLAVGPITSNNSGSVSQANEDFLMGVNRKLNTNFFKGAIDELRIYRCALDSSAIAQLADTNATFKNQVSLQEGTNIPFSIYPNPATDRLQIEWSGVDADMQIQLFNLNGQLMRKETLSADKASSEMYVSDLERGFYIFRIINSEGQLVNTGKLLLN